MTITLRVPGLLPVVEERSNCVPEEGTGAYDLLSRYGVKRLHQPSIPREYFTIPQNEREARTWEYRRALGDRLVVLGHHYQREEVVQFADFRGDSFKLSQQAASRSDAEFILFCGVHFMAESSDILTGPDQKVILPNLEAGCSMADMAKIGDVRDAWQTLADLGVENVIPITYMNSAASLKSFVGEHGGIVCTSSNAGKTFDWAFDRGERILFFPDEHLGRNTAVRHGIPEDRMVVWDPFKPCGGNTPEQLQHATVILWKGYCSVHARFSIEQIEQARREDPTVNVIVHPECRLEVVQAADLDGSTELIIDTVRNAPDGTSWAVGTEINLVKRLAVEQPGKRIFCLDPVVCPCSTMYRVHPAYVLWAMERLAHGEVVNRIVVDAETRRWALVALERMLAIA